MTIWRRTSFYDIIQYIIQCIGASMSAAPSESAYKMARFFGFGPNFRVLFCSILTSSPAENYLKSGMKIFIHFLSINIKNSVILRLNPDLREVYLLILSTTTLSLLLAPVLWRVSIWSFNNSRRRHPSVERIWNVNSRRLLRSNFRQIFSANSTKVVHLMIIITTYNEMHFA